MTKVTVQFANFCQQFSLFESASVHFTVWFGFLVDHEQAWIPFFDGKDNKKPYEN